MASGASLASRPPPPVIAGELLALWIGVALTCLAYARLPSSASRRWMRSAGKLQNHFSGLRFGSVGGSAMQERQWIGKVLSAFVHAPEETGATPQGQSSFIATLNALHARRTLSELSANGSEPDVRQQSLQALTIMQLDPTDADVLTERLNEIQGESVHLTVRCAIAALVDAVRSGDLNIGPPLRPSRP